MVHKIYFKQFSAQEKQAQLTPETDSTSRGSSVIISEPKFFKENRYSLEKNNNFEQCRSEYVRTVDELIRFHEKKGKSLKPPITDALSKLTTSRLNEFSIKINHTYRDHFGNDLHLIYGAGKQFLEAISDLTRNEKIPLDIRVNTITEMATKLNACPGGIVTKMQETFVELNAQIGGLHESTNQLKTKLLESVILEFMMNKNIRHRHGNQVHYVNAFYNYICENIGLQPRTDSLTTIAETRISTKLLNECKEVALKRITPEKVVQEAAQSYMDEVKTAAGRDLNEPIDNKEIAKTLDKVFSAQDRSLKRKFGEVSYNEYLSQNEKDHSWRFTSQNTLLSRHFLKKLADKGSVAIEIPTKSIEKSTGPISLNIDGDFGKLHILGDLVWREADGENREVSFNELAKIPSAVLHKNINELELEDTEKLSLYSKIFTHLNKTRGAGNLRNIDEALFRVMVDTPPADHSMTLYQGAFEIAQASNSTGVIEKLIGHHPGFLNYVNKDGLNPIEHAAKYGHMETFKLLLAKNEDPIHADDYNKKKYFSNNHKVAIAFSLAAKHGHLEILKEYKGKLPECNFWLTNETSLGMSAVENEQWQVLCFLIDNSLISYHHFNKDLDDVITMAARTGSYDIHEYIISGLSEAESTGIIEKYDFNRFNRLRQSPLSICAENNFEYILEWFLGMQDPNLKDKDGHTAFTKAAAKGHVSIMEKLLEDRSLDLEAKDDSGQTALIHAARGGHIDAVSLILRKINNKSTKLDYVNAADNQGIRALEAAITRKDYDMATLLIENNSDFGFNFNVEAKLLSDPHQLIANKQTVECPIWYFAVRHGGPDIVNAMINKGFDVNTPIPATRETPLQIAAAEFQLGTLQTLLRHGATDHQQPYLPSLLLSALPNNKHPESDTFNGLSAILDLSRHNTIYGNHIKPSTKYFFPQHQEKTIVNNINILLSHGANINKVNSLGITPLLSYILNNSTNAAKLLISHNASVNQACSRGGTPLMYAARQGNVDIISDLLKSGAIVNAKSKGKHTAVSLSIEAKNFRATKQLLSHGAIIEHRILRKFEGELLQHITEAIKSADTSFVEHLIQNSEEKVKGLIFNKSLLCAAAFGNAGTIRHLHALGKYINPSPTPILSLETPLCHAVKHDNIEGIRALLVLGANPNGKGLDENSAIDMATQMSKPELLEILKHNTTHKNQLT